MILTVDEIDERNRLEAMAERKMLYCTKHEKIVTKCLFWSKRCYLSRSKDKCEYLEIRRSR